MTLIGFAQKKNQQRIIKRFVYYILSFLAVTSVMFVC